MTKHDRVKQLLQTAQFLGRVFPLWGVREGRNGQLACECGRQKCKNPGKHPSHRNWQQEATSDKESILEWVVKWPNGNFGVVTGESVLALDLDVRADRNGVAELEQSEFDSGERTSYP